MIFKKYSPVGEMSEFAETYCEVLARTSSFPTIVCDKDHVIAVAGTSKKEYMERRITPALEELMESRNKNDSSFHPIEGIERTAAIVYPVIASGDVTGAVIMLSNDEDTIPEESDAKIAQTAAIFIGKQTEE